MPIPAHCGSYSHQPISPQQPASSHQPVSPFVLSALVCLQTHQELTFGVLSARVDSFKSELEQAIAAKECADKNISQIDRQMPQLSAQHSERTAHLINNNEAEVEVVKLKHAVCTFDSYTVGILSHRCVVLTGTSEETKRGDAAGDCSGPS